MDENLINPPNTDPPAVRQANGRLMFAAAIAGFFVFLGGFGAFYFYASHGTETGPGQTAQIQQAAQSGPGNPGNAEPPRENNPNPPGDRSTRTPGGTPPSSNGAPAR